MDKIDEAEQAVAAVEAELGNAFAPGTAPGHAAAVQKRLDEARAAAAKLTARWEDLESRKGG